MSLLPGLYNRMSDRLTRFMGEPVAFVLSGGDVTATAHYRSPWEGITVGGVAMEHGAHTLDMATAALPAGAKEGGAVRVRGLDMTITEISGDDGGMTRLLLAEYRA